MNAPWEAPAGGVLRLAERLFAAPELGSAALFDVLRRADAMAAMERLFGESLATGESSERAPDVATPRLPEAAGQGPRVAATASDRVWLNLAAELRREPRAEVPANAGHGQLPPIVEPLFGQAPGAPFPAAKPARTTPDALASVTAASGRTVLLPSAGERARERRSNFSGGAGEVTRSVADAVVAAIRQPVPVMPKAGFVDQAGAASKALADESASTASFAVRSPALVQPKNESPALVAAHLPESADRTSRRRDELPSDRPAADLRQNSAGIPPAATMVGDRGRSTRLVSGLADLNGLFASVLADKPPAVARDRQSATAAVASPAAATDREHALARSPFSPPTLVSDAPHPGIDAGSPEARAASADFPGPTAPLASTAWPALTTLAPAIADPASDDILLDRLLERWQERLREQAIRHLGFTGGLS